MPRFSRIRSSRSTRLARCLASLSFLAVVDSQVVVAAVVAMEAAEVVAADMVTATSMRAAM